MCISVETQSASRRSQASESNYGNSSNTSWLNPNFIFPKTFHNDVPFSHSVVKKSKRFLVCWRSLQCIVCHQKFMLGSGAWSVEDMCIHVSHRRLLWKSTEMCWFWSGMPRLCRCQQKYTKDFFLVNLVYQLTLVFPPEIGCNTLMFKFCLCWLVQTFCKLNLTCAPKEEVGM